MQVGGPGQQTLGVTMRHVDHGGQEKRLAARAAFQHLGADRLMSQAFMRRVLIHQHQGAVGGDRQYIGVQHLGHGCAQRVLRLRGGGRQDAGRRAGIEGQARLGETARAATTTGWHTGQRQSTDPATGGA